MTIVHQTQRQPPQHPAQDAALCHTDPKRASAGLDNIVGDDGQAVDLQDAFNLYE